MSFELVQPPHHNAAAELLIEAADAIGQRAEQRDQPDGERSMRRAVAAFNAMYDTRLTEVQGWQFMALLKMARAVWSPTSAAIAARTYAKPCTNWSARLR